MTSRYASAPASETAAINLVADQIVDMNTSAYNAVTSSSPTLTAAQMVNGIVALSGQTAAQTVTTDTASALAALLHNVQVGSEFDVVIMNNHTSAGAATLAGGTGVTIVGDAVIPIGRVQAYKGIVTNATTPTITLYAMNKMITPAAQYSTAALQSAVIPAANLAGAHNVNFDNTGTTPGNLQVDTAANIIAAIPNAFIGQSYILRIRNSSGSANTATITTNTGVTLTGTMTIAQNVARDFVVTVTGAATVTIQSMGISAAGA